MIPRERTSRYPVVGIVLLSVTLNLTGHGARAAGVFKWTDPQGRIHYDDSNVLEQRLTLDYLNRRGVPAHDDANTPADFADAVRRRCSLAQDRLNAYRGATSLEGRDPAGNSYVLSPRQMQIEIAVADRDQRRYCAPGAAERLYREPPPPAVRAIPVEQR